MYLLGYDIGSSSIKASLVSADSGEVITSSFSPEKEMEIVSCHSGWAEQDPEIWWKHVINTTQKIIKNRRVDVKKIRAIGISYQMHGLVMIDKNKKILRKSIIWCDSRAVEIGKKAFKQIGSKHCFERYLNSPGNFTASKLKWVKDYEPQIYSKIYKIMLPGDYIAWRMTGKIRTTPEGLSEAILWDFKKNNVALDVLDCFGISHDFIPELAPTFSFQGELTKQAADELGLHPSTPITYRAGDQPNNAFSLGVLNTGEIAATAGTSGVIYGISNRRKCEKKSRVNIFLHVNHTKEDPRYGVLLCINGTAILNSWLKNNLLSFKNEIDYHTMDRIAHKAPIGSDGLIVLPFGNGAERIFENKDIGCQIVNLKFNTHSTAHLLRAVQEGIVFSMKYGLDVMKKMGVKVHLIKAGYANMFLSPVFHQAFSDVTGASLELYDTSGSSGAARAAGYGAGIYKKITDSFIGLKKIKTITPDKENVKKYREVYYNWLNTLNKNL